MPRLITRSEWGARPPKSVTALKLPTSELILHHSASASGGAERVRQIQDFHMDVRGWSDIAYHFLINHRGDIYEGRRLEHRGGATSGQNSVSHAICILGNYNTSLPTPEAVTALVDLVRLIEVWPNRITGGHRDYVTTSCPGNNLYPLIPGINERIEEETVDKQTFMAWMAEFFDVKDKTDHTGDIYRHSWLVGNSTWRSEVGRDTNREYLSSVLVQARNFARDDFLNGDGVLELSDEDLAAMAEAVADEQARRLQS